MFTGIIEKTGIVAGWERSKRSRTRTLTVRCPGGFSAGLKVGGSVSVNGACLTVVRKKPSELSFHVVNETLKRTALGGLKAGERTHLELPLKTGARLDGHFVLGHVDGKGKVLKAVFGKKEARLLIGFPAKLKPYFLEKGSVTVNGVSLTIGRVGTGSFWVHLVPHTLKKTCFASARAGDSVNLEADILVKLLAKMFSR